MAEKTFEDYDLKNQQLLKRIEFLSLDQIQGSNTLKNPLENTRSNRSFDEVTFDIKYGELEKCKPHEDNFHNGPLNVKQLINDIREKGRDESAFFYYQKYTSN